MSGSLGTITEINEWVLDEMDRNGQYQQTGLEALTFVPDDWMTAANFAAAGFPPSGSAFPPVGVVRAPVRADTITSRRSRM